MEACLIFFFLQNPQRFIYLHKLTFKKWVGTSGSSQNETIQILQITLPFRCYLQNHGYSPHNRYTLSQHQNFLYSPFLLKCHFCRFKGFKGSVSISLIFSDTVTFLLNYQNTEVSLRLPNINTRVNKNCSNIKDQNVQKKLADDIFP